MQGYSNIETLQHSPYPYRRPVSNKNTTSPCQMPLKQTRYLIQSSSVRMLSYRRDLHTTGNFKVSILRSFSEPKRRWWRNRNNSSNHTWAMNQKLLQNRVDQLNLKNQDLKRRPWLKNQINTSRPSKSIKGLHSWHPVPYITHQHHEKLQSSKHKRQSLDDRCTCSPSPFRPNIHPKTPPPRTERASCTLSPSKTQS